MQKIMFWVFVLILTYILVAYYRGTQSVIAAFGGFFNNSVLYLQGRDSAGNVSSYAKDPNF